MCHEAAGKGADDTVCGQQNADPEKTNAEGFRIYRQDDVNKGIAKKRERQSARRQPKAPSSLILLFFFGLGHAPSHL